MKKKALLNIISSSLCQVVTIISGLIVPRLFLTTFGSEANGLVSSLTQFLNYISLIEGGIGSVVLTALYGPLAKRDDEKLSSVMKAAEKFLKQIAYVFVVYTILLACIYPLLIKSSFSWIFISSLTIILSISLFIQYFFTLTYKLVLQADQKMYIVQLIQIVVTVLNLGTVAFVVKVVPQLHIVKLFSTFLFIIQPIVLRQYIKKHYSVLKDAEPDKDALSQRWAGFGQNLAYFINRNTDVTVLTFFSDLKTVSVYSVYFLVVNHLQSSFKSFSHAFHPMIGKAIAIRNYNQANKYLDIYEFLAAVFTFFQVLFCYILVELLM